VISVTFQGFSGATCKGSPFCHNMMTKVLYHYTDKDSFDAIKRDGCIRPSVDVAGRLHHRGPGGRHGAGVYLTDMDPGEYERSDVARNNYGVGWKKNLRKTDHYVAVMIPDDDLFLTFLGGRNWLYKGPSITRDMFHSSGLNAKWDPSAIIASVAVGAGLAALSSALSMYSSYREQERLREEITAQEMEEKQKEEVKKALELKNDMEQNIWESLKRKPTPSDFIASSRNIGGDIDRFIAGSIQKFCCLSMVALAVVGAKAGLASCVCVASLHLFGLPLVGSLLDSNVPIDISSVVDEEDQILFRHEEKPQESWFQLLTSLVIAPSKTIDLKLDVTVWAFGLVRVAKVSLPLAASSDIERNYYWICLLGKWYAVTVYHYLQSVPQTADISQQARTTNQKVC